MRKLEVPSLCRSSRQLANGANMIMNRNIAGSIMGALVLMLCGTMAQVGVLSKPEVATALAEPEKFDDSDRPRFVHNQSSNYHSCVPWNYDKPQNAARSYPLVVFLHGAGGAGNIDYLNHLGYFDPAKSSADVTARSFQSRRPSFVLVPQTSGSWTNPAIIGLIEHFKSTYRIDPRRVYLIGYSMGGSGSYALANAYCDHNGGLFAGIIRLAGQSQTEVRKSIAQRSSIWLHVGLRDNPIRIQMARDAYAFLKTYHTNAVETQSAIHIPGHPGSTHTLTVDGKEVAKLSEYTEDGHGIVTFPFQDERLLEWLYAQVSR